MRYELRGVLIGAVGLVLSIGVPAGRAAAADTGETTGGVIVIRSYAQPSLDRDIESARRTASAILEDARIEIDWVDCGRRLANTSSDTCRQPLGPNEFIMRFASGGPVAIGSAGNALGFALLDGHAGAGSLATVFTDRVHAMAKGTGISAAELLGRAMAHEIGHLLLGTSSHAAEGLMRASWSRADLRQDRTARWLFGATEAEMMRRGIASRIRVADAGIQARQRRGDES